MRQLLCLNCGELNESIASKCKNCRQENPFELGSLHCTKCACKTGDKNNHCTQCKTPMKFKVDFRADSLSEADTEKSFESIEWYRVHFYRVLGKAEIKVSMLVGLVLFMALCAISLTTPDFGWFQFITVGYAFLVGGILVNLIVQAIVGRQAFQSTVKKLELPKNAYVDIDTPLPKNVLLNLLNNRILLFVGRLKASRFRPIVPAFIEKFATWKHVENDIKTQFKLKK